MQRNGAPSGFGPLGAHVWKGDKMASNAQRPNVLLIMCDQMRGDCLGIDGHPDVKTPYLDTLAADGMLFENAYARLALYG